MPAIAANDGQFTISLQNFMFKSAEPISTHGIFMNGEAGIMRFTLVVTQPGTKKESVHMTIMTDELVYFARQLADFGEGKNSHCAIDPNVNPHIELVAWEKIMKKGWFKKQATTYVYFQVRVAVEWFKAAYRLPSSGSYSHADGPPVKIETTREKLGAFAHELMQEIYEALGGEMLQTARKLYDE